ncbi:hypothetical protein DM02DRAFT_635838 [Periconia macrospinosa]|uniref:Uncharacterized protein n=1 Tax=Periconia macrospinosa TaxID=97972 RepID=A0A2V1D2Y4_9PLEO|nr:hypothetical protein DM02DRAFT_635838 [Periconia macrospinosa]
MSGAPLHRHLGIHELSPVLRSQVLVADADLYPDHVTLKGGCTIETKDIFSLRGSDAPRETFQLKLPTIICTEGEKGKRWLRLPMSYTLQQSMALGEGQVPSPFTIAKEDAIRLDIHLDTQAPHIRIHLFDTKTNSPCSATIFSEHLGWFNNEPLLPISVEHITVTSELNSCLSNMSRMKHPKVVRLQFFLPGVHWLEKGQKEQGNALFWEGISANRLQELRDSRDDDRSSAFYKVLTGAKRVKMYFAVAGSNIPRWERMGDYMRRVFTLANYWGNFWFYHDQMGPDENQMEVEEGEIADQEIPKQCIPRWLVKEYQLDLVQSGDGSSRLENPKPSKWNSICIPQLCAHPDDLAFFLRLGIKQELDRQTKRLIEMSENTSHLEGVFHAVPRTDNYLHVVEVIKRTEDSMQDLRSRFPIPGMSIMMNVFHPLDPRTFEVHGIIVAGAFGSTASYTAVVCGTQARVIAQNSRIPIRVQYIVYNALSQKHIDAVSMIQRIPSKSKPFGPDIKRLILGCHEPVTAERNWKATEGQVCSVHNTINRKTEPVPNDIQKDAIMDTVQSESGTTVIIGSQNTGKTTTSILVAHIHASLLSQKVLYVAYHSIQESIQAWLSDPDNKLAGHEWVHFTGARVSLSAIQRLQTQYRFIDKHHVELENSLWDFVHDADERGVTPELQWNFRFKSKQRIEAWSKDATHCMHTIACDYLQALKNLNNTYAHENIKQAKQHANALEYYLNLHYLKYEVKVVFCDPQASIHPLLLEIPTWEEVIMHEAAGADMVDLSVILAGLIGRVGHMTWTGDISEARQLLNHYDANVAADMLTRGVFQPLAKNPKEYAEVGLPKGYFVLDDVNSTTATETKDEDYVEAERAGKRVRQPSEGPNKRGRGGSAGPSRTSGSSVFRGAPSNRRGNFFYSRRTGSWWMLEWTPRWSCVGLFLPT